jgi:hypothetical protein
MYKRNKRAEIGGDEPTSKDSHQFLATTRIEMKRSVLRASR